MAPAQAVPVLYPTVQEFSRSFTEFVSEVFRRDPDLPCFKVVPPEGWSASRIGPHDLDSVVIKTPIRQHVFGKSGAYRCVLVESKSLTVEEFRRLADEEAASAPGHKAHAAVDEPEKAAQPKGKGRSTDVSADDQKERSFWSSVTVHPPLYGADTPVSFFDEKLPYGWNLRHLGDLLSTHNVPEIPGVTTPMTYFGMWRSFFGWHKEDADLLSINYLHFGAPKMWYCVSPKHKDKFERMASSLFPQQAQACQAFIRHKDILVSPSQLRAHSVPYMQVKQEKGEFVVLNAAAYHAGFNMGFNCAEAINFATEDWIDVGKAANRCSCDALKDGVRISMKLFDPTWVSDDDTSEEEGEDETQRNAREALLEQRRKDRLQALLLYHKARANTGEKPAPLLLPPNTHPFQKQVLGKGTRILKPGSKVITREPQGSGASDEAGSDRSPAALHQLRLQQVKQPTTLAMGHRVMVPMVPRPPVAHTPPALRPGGWGVAGKRAAAEDDSTAAARKRRGADKQIAMQTPLPAPTQEPDGNGWSNPPPPPARTRGRPSEMAMVLKSDPVTGSPYAVLWDDDDGRHFRLVMRLQQEACPNKPNYIRLRVLAKCSDGLYYPTKDVWEEHPSTLVAIRTRATLNPRHPVTGVRSDVPAYELLTNPKRLLATELR